MHPLRPPTHLVLLFAVALLATVVLQVAGGLVHSAGCDLRALTDDEYLAYCPNRGFLDYEHGALFYDLEPGVLPRLRAADVLFLGSSVMQRALHAEPLAREFDRRGIRWYALGFSYGETWRFPLALLARHALRPRVLVINADPFFASEPTPVSRAILEDRFDATHVGYLYRHWLQRAKRAWCTTREASPWCRGSGRMTLRARTTGLWRSPSLPATRVPAREERPAPAPADDFDTLVAHARAFIAASGVPPACVVLTRIPSSFDDAARARALADAVGATWVRPTVAALTTFDDYHLDPDSARRWSAAFLPALLPTVARCAAAGSVATP